MTPRPHASQQTKLLRKRITLRVFFNWVIYTFIFCLVAFVLNYTLVPKIAENIASSTSEWITYYLDDYNLDEVLNELNLDLVGYSTDLSDWTPEQKQDSEILLATIKAKTVKENQDNTNSDDKIDKDVNLIGQNESAFTENEVDRDPNAADTGADDTDMVDYSELLELIQSTSESSNFIYTPVYPYYEDMTTRSGHVISKRRYADDNNTTPDGTSLSDKALLVLENGEPHFTTLRMLQREMIARPYSTPDWQVMLNDTSVSVRYLSLYNAFRTLKWPIVICLYLIGCIVIVFKGYGSAMKYFDELESAVADMLSDREKPIVLSRQLALTQNELNSIRLASLADERAAKAAEQRKDELVAYLAHDVKTPLTSVLGYLMLLDEAPEIPEDVRKRYIHVVMEKSQRLESLIDEFFEITRYNLQAIPIERQKANVRMFCEQVCDEFYPEASSRDITIEIEADDEDTFFVDDDKFARALGNVLRNAVAYADPNTTITLKAEQLNTEPKSKKDSKGEALVCTTVISVANQGREISENHLKTIFEKFYREDSSRSSSSGGSGLGLAIAKEIVLSHGGTIDAESTDGVTTFVISVPTYG